jgi:hypothetical protein
MSLHDPESLSNRTDKPAAPGRRLRGSHLILSELNPSAVIDHLGGNEQPMALVTFGDVRETCPKCHRHHLQLVLRQHHVRIAHLFCTDCESCFDAHYPNGTPALTI